jgi:succinate dehydrogenase / fumarate reductase iron-sulfur subunit
MITQMDKEGFGNCSNIGECRAACPKEISIDYIAKMRREFAHALKDKV